MKFVEEIPLAESLFITAHLSPFHHRWWKNSLRFKKLLKMRVETTMKAHYKAFTGITFSTVI